MSGIFFGYDFWGKTTPWAEHYNSGGYIAYLPKKSFEKASKKLEKLKTAKWLSNGSRLLLVDFHLYNGNVNQFVAVRLAFEKGVAKFANFEFDGIIVSMRAFFVHPLFEIPPYGGVTPSHQIISTQLKPRLQDFRQVFKQSLHGVFAGVIGFLLLEKLYEILTVGLVARLKSMSFLQSTVILLLSVFVLFHDLY